MKFIVASSCILAVTSNYISDGLSESDSYDSLSASAKKSPEHIGPVRGSSGWKLRRMSAPSQSSEKS